MVSGTCALPELVVVEVEGEQGSGPEGVDDLCWYLSFKAGIWATRLEIGSPG